MLFWLCALLIAFAYAGYPAWLYFLARFWPRPVRHPNFFTMITIVLAARNEEENLVSKLQTSTGLITQQTSLKYWLSRMVPPMGQIRIFAAWESAAHGAVISPVHRGKASALISRIAEARGEICGGGYRAALFRGGEEVSLGETNEWSPDVSVTHSLVPTRDSV